MTKNTTKGAFTLRTFKISTHTHTHPPSLFKNAIFRPEWNKGRKLKIPLKTERKRKSIFRPRADGKTRKNPRTNLAVAVGAWYGQVFSHVHTTL